MKTVQTQAKDIRVGDKIVFPSYPDTPWIVVSAALNRGIFTELSLKKDGVANRSLPEYRLEVPFTMFLRKVIN